MNKFRFLIFLHSCTMIFANESYLWPTDASNTLTGTFCEERPFRYHAGIDIRTYGKNAKIFATEDGYIERIRTGSKGYGKAIYLRLNDGNIAQYAHLDGFDDELNRIARRIQEKSGSYTIDYSFKKNEFPVSEKGYLLYYNGDASKPHLGKEMYFRRTLIPFLLDTSWIDSMISEMHSCLQKDEMPESGPECENCLYLETAKKI